MTVPRDETDAERDEYANGPTPMMQEVMDELAAENSRILAELQEAQRLVTLYRGEDIRGQLAQLGEMYDAEKAANRELDAELERVKDHCHDRAVALQSQLTETRDQLEAQISASEALLAGQGILTDQLEKAEAALAQLSRMAPLATSTQMATFARTALEGVTHREAIGAVQPSAGVGDAHTQDDERG